MKFIDIIDTAVHSLNFRITNKAVPVLMPTENLLKAGRDGRPLNDGDLDTVCMQYPDPVSKLPAQTLTQFVWWHS